jgi:biopolymer transport protein ExbD
MVQGVSVARVDEVMAKTGNDIPALREALVSQNDRVIQRASTDSAAPREVTIMGDRDIPYRLLKKVMATCTGSDFGKISLAVMQKSSDELDRMQAAR